jgi:hypothetical protein
MTDVTGLIEAIDELHGCIIRRPGDTCKVRKEYLNAALHALTAQQSMIDELEKAATDALAGWRYIRQNHGDLYGVGWDRVETSLHEALTKGRAK